MNKIKSIYKFLRSVVMTLVVSVALLYIAAYILISVPSVQDGLKDRIARECSDLLGSELRIDKFSISPFNEVVLRGVSLEAPDGSRCASIDRVSAGLDLWQLVTSRKIVITYALISKLQAEIIQYRQDGPVNIQFLIDALSPKDKNKPAAIFDLRFRNVVIRDSKAIFCRRWMLDSLGNDSHAALMKMDGLRLDMSIPRFSNDEFIFDVRNLRFSFNDELFLRHLGGQIVYTKPSDNNDSHPAMDVIRIKGLNLDFPHSHLEFGDLSYELKSDRPLDLNFEGSVSPSDFKLFFDDLDQFPSAWTIMSDMKLSPSAILLNNLYLADSAEGSRISIMGHASGINTLDSLNVVVADLDAVVSAGLLSRISKFINKNNSKISNLIDRSGYLGIKADGTLSMPDDMAEGRAEITTGLGKAAIDVSLDNLKSIDSMKSAVEIDASDIDLGIITGNPILGKATFYADADLIGRDKNLLGSLDLHIDKATIYDTVLADIELTATKTKEALSFSFDSYDDCLMLSGSGSCALDQNPKISADVVVANLRPGIFRLSGPFGKDKVSFEFSAGLDGLNPDMMTGYATVSDLVVERENFGKLYLSEMTLSAKQSDEDSGRIISLTSDWLEASVKGKICLSRIGQDIKDLIADVIPSLMPGSGSREWPDSGSSFADSPGIRNNFSFNINIPGNSEPYSFFSIPFRPLSDISVDGSLNSDTGIASLNLDARHIQQGKNKLIRDVKLNCTVNSHTGIASVHSGLVYPAKKGDVQLEVDVSGFNDALKTRIAFNPTMKSSLKGEVGLNARFSRLPVFDRFNGFVSPLAVDVDILPSDIVMSGTAWNVADGHILYVGNEIDVDNLKISHGNQYVKIAGKVSDNAEDAVTVRLNDIDLDYIFGMLNINYVTFGGMASGEIVGSKLLTSSPDARTKFLRVRNLSYNDAVLGNGDLAADYDPLHKEVEIFAVIRDPVSNHKKANVGGGIWVTKDSLSFSFDADKINLAFMKPFVSAFCSDLKGYGSGKCKLYGTFSDIDLVGDLYADTIAMKLDFTNTWYFAGGDSVRMSKGLIDVPAVTLYDKFGNTAKFNGWLRHRYFHDPVFDFRIHDAKGILCYDTNEHINPLWYGTIFGQGGGQVAGRPGLVEISMDMTTRAGSAFTYVITDSEEMDEYSFLTFTDRSKALKEAENLDTVPYYLRRFLNRKLAEDTGSSDVVLNLRGSVTPDALVTIVMDPKGGDKITARGSGGLQMDYNSADNNLRMFGKYVLDEGNYNFTLQDIIIKNFIIKEGSTISFNGDPMDANLDIAATYRVNTNLTDLDKSFASDKELNRTNVPVDALLLVTGPMTQPDINFDISLPTLTSDVERKVKSIVSTNDMMSRQIIYLLALNRFYTPEYTGNNSSGAEWSSMASSTISSQLSNMLSQMTDKLSVAPSFRSDKGDFTDMEFDLALSSRLLNNRLLINGNFGYRDRNTSSTQFVGDFDIEYLLSRNGNLRLKAYNHFNDQNYYLRSALTTQGVGVLYRWDFDRLGKKRNSLPLPVLHRKDSIEAVRMDSLSTINYDLK